MSKSNASYSDQRAAILFKAARDMRLVACQVLDDVQNEVELLSDTPAWAKSVAKKTAELASDLENRGWEDCGFASTRTQNLLLNSKLNYSQSIDAFEARIDRARIAAAKEGERV